MLWEQKARFPVPPMGYHYPMPNTCLVTGGKETGEMEARRSTKGLATLLGIVCWAQQALPNHNGLILA